MPEQTRTSDVPRPLVVLAWVWVGAPFVYGVVQLLAKVGQLFGS